MALRIPPRRVGRTWLLGRLDVAYRGAELLDRKRQVLLAEQARVRAQAEQARQDWHEATGQVQAWTWRAGMVDGEIRLELLVRHARARASLELSWRNLMGAQLPRVDAIDIQEPPPLSALGASSASVLLARACSEAARAAARYAVSARAEAELTAELGGGHDACERCEIDGSRSTSRPSRHLTLRSTRPNANRPSASAG